MPKKAAKRRRSRKNHTPVRRQSGLGLIFWGLALMLVFSAYRVYSLNILSFGSPTITQTATGPAPIQIDIPRVNLHLAISQATVTDGTWEISPTGASHWDNSANPGEAGNIVIYGHNKTNLFGPIRWLNFGDEIILTDADGSLYKYQVTATATVSPNQTELIQPKNQETLTLYTCTGIFDSQRYVVTAATSQ